MTTASLPPRPPGVGKRGPLPGTGRKPIHHNTNGGYVAHLRRGEDACPPCLGAHARYESGRRTPGPVDCRWCGRGWPSPRGRGVHEHYCLENPENR